MIAQQQTAIPYHLPDVIVHANANHQQTSGAAVTFAAPQVKLAVLLIALSFPVSNPFAQARSDFAMADQSLRRSRKTKQKAKKRNGTTTVERPERPRDQMERVPSNAPTMAIAPSDYEHIFHEAPAVSPPAAAGQFATIGVERNSPAPAAASPPPPPPPPPVVARTPPPPPLPVAPLPQARVVPRPRDDYDPYPQTNQFGKHQYALEVQATPDGYTMLGHAPDLTGGRRVALPPHIVRAGNQFSRAALARVSRYLASRAEAGTR